MTTLYKRATPSQAMILRIVEGAVINAADAHGLRRDKTMARSIAKRAAGTLTAQWPEVLAVDGPSEAKAVSTASHGTGHRAIRRRRKRSYAPRPDANCGDRLVDRRSPLKTLWHRIKRKMWKIKREGNIEAAEAMILVLREIDRLIVETEEIK